MFEREQDQDLEDTLFLIQFTVQSPLDLENSIVRKQNGVEQVFSKKCHVLFDQV